MGWFFGDRTVFVGNLSWDTRWQGLKDHMRQAGNVIHAEVFSDASGRSSGCGIVEFELPEEAQHAMQTMTDSVLDGRQIFVREDREANRRGGGGGGSFGANRMDMDRGGFGDRGGMDFGGGRGGGGWGGQRSDRGRKIVVCNLPYHTKWQELKDIFRSCGEVIHADVMIGSDGRSKGMGTVLFESEQQAHHAIQELNGAELDGRVIEVRHDRY